jgi:2,3-bisphosphoglycerate-dependent phosphoglycerate mutase
LPLTESLKETIDRVNPCWEELIEPKLQLYDTVLISAHGNSLRALAMMLLHMTPDEIMKVEIPTGAPWVFELDRRFSVLKEYYL